MVSAPRGTAAWAASSQRRNRARGSSPDSSSASRNGSSGSVAGYGASGCRPAAADAAPFGVGHTAPHPLLLAVGKGKRQAFLPNVTGGADRLRGTGLFVGRRKEE